MQPLQIPDLSHYEPVSSFHDVAASGCGAIITKATQGTTGADPTYEDYYKRAKASGLIVGAYHYLLPHNVPAQMEHFLRVAHLTKGDLRPIIDAEAPGLDKEDTGAALGYLGAKGLRPILYASLAFWRDTLGGPSDHALWLAAYRSTLPVLPRGVTLFAWQHTDAGHCPGVDRPCDMSYFYGTVNDLKTYCL